MAQTSLYDVLRVDQNATLDEIKLAFKRRALQVHPDKGGSKEKFHLQMKFLFATTFVGIMVYQALETLGDPAARQKYDHSLTATKTGRASHASYPKEKRRREKVNMRNRPQAAKQRRKQSLRCLKRSRQLLLVRLQVNLHGLQLRQQNRNQSRPSC